MKRFWPVAVVGLIGVALSANLVLLYLAASDPEFSVEPDYYAKGLRWDERRAQERQNAGLGWTLELVVDPERSADGSQTVEVRLLDADSAPIAGATLTLTAFPNASAADMQPVEMRDQGDGMYSGALRFHRPGLWEFRLDARRGQDRFTKILLEDVVVRPFRQARGQP